MIWAAVLLSAAVAAGLAIAVAAKWKLPRHPTWAWIVVTALTVAVPFVWVYGQLVSTAAIALTMGLQISTTLAAAFALAMVAFWRDPERTPPDQPGAILSAADGLVLTVVEVDSGTPPLVRKDGRDYSLAELVGEDVLAGGATVIAVEMNLLNVHVNRCPITGQVQLLKRIRGVFLSLRRAEAPFLNERVTTVIQTPHMTIAVVQVSSRLVRRIESYLAVGQAVCAGQRLGRIRFGSLVAVVVAKRADVQILVKPGDTVQAGVTILACYTIETS